MEIALYCTRCTKWRMFFSKRVAHMNQTRIHEKKRIILKQSFFSQAHWISETDIRYADVHPCTVVSFPERLCLCHSPHKNQRSPKDVWVYLMYVTHIHLLFSKSDQNRRIWFWVILCCVCNFFKLGRCCCERSLGRQSSTSRILIERKEEFLN